MGCELVTIAATVATLDANARTVLVLGRVDAERTLGLRLESEENLGAGQLRENMWQKRVDAGRRESG